MEKGNFMNPLTLAQSIEIRKHMQTCNYHFKYEGGPQKFIASAPKAHETTLENCKVKNKSTLFRFICEAFINKVYAQQHTKRT